MPQRPFFRRKRRDFLHRHRFVGELRKTRGKFHLLQENREFGDTKGNHFFGTALFFHAHHVAGKLNKTRFVGMRHIAHPARNNCREPKAVRDRGVPPGQSMFHAVAGPVFFKPETEVAVVRKGARKPHLTPGIVVADVFHHFKAVCHNRFQSGFGLAACVVHGRGVCEVALHDVAHHVNDARRNLLFRERKKELRIDCRHFGADHAVTHPELFVTLGDDAAD